MKNIDIDIDMVILENIDINMFVLENIDTDIYKEILKYIDKAILQNIDIDNISYRFRYVAY